jgi:hypothetical protein
VTIWQMMNDLPDRPTARSVGRIDLRVRQDGNCFPEVFWKRFQFTDPLLAKAGTYLADRLVPADRKLQIGSQISIRRRRHKRFELL